MKLNLLQKKIIQIQNEYKSLLEYISEKFIKEYSLEVLDEIELFWYRYSKTIQLYLKMFVEGNDNYIFAASTYMDYEDNEHLPFLLLGDKHIFDDPLCKYSKTYSLTYEDNNIEFIKEEINKTIIDNLELLSQCIE